MNDDYILILLNEIKQSSLYGNYMSIKKSSFEEDKEFVLKESEKLFDVGQVFSEYRIITANKKEKWIC